VIPVLDVDGVLVDSTAAHRRVWDAWARMRGLDPAVVWRATHGRRPEDTVAEVARGLDPAAERAVLDELLAREEDAIGAMAGAHALVTAIAGAPWAIVTSGDRAVTTARLRRLGLAEPPVAVFGEDVDRGKPDPEGYERAVELLGAAPAACVVVEDAPAGVAAARAAGCRVLAVATTHPRAELAAADEVLDDLVAVAAALTSR
jgi:mannitol-1-/sugar-/sorbitol-6-phosphatase